MPAPKTIANNPRTWPSSKAAVSAILQSGAYWLLEGTAAMGAAFKDILDSPKFMIVFIPATFLECLKPEENEEFKSRKVARRAFDHNNVFGDRSEHAHTRTHTQTHCAKAPRTHEH